MATLLTPFHIDSTGKVAKTNDLDLTVRQMIIDVLTTLKFERLTRPSYGAGIYSLMFEPVDDLVFGEFRIEALSLLNANVPQATIVDLQIKPADLSPMADGYSTTLTVTVSYSMRMLGIKTFSVNITAPDLLTQESAI
jgi:phage baseplate assembly protein W